MKKNDLVTSWLLHNANGAYYRGTKYASIGVAVGCAVFAIWSHIMSNKEFDAAMDEAYKLDNGE